MTKEPPEALSSETPRVQCTACENPLEGKSHFCPACGTRRPRSAPLRAIQTPTIPEELACPGCGLAVGEEPLRFCRQCGHLLPTDLPAGSSFARSRAARQPLSPGLCQACGQQIETERKFCRHCGAARFLQRGADAAGLHDPAWHATVTGLSWIFTGTVILVASAVFAAAAVTLLSLFALSSAGGTLETALLGASAVLAASGLGILVWGDVLDLRIPAKGSRVLGVTTLALGIGAASLGALALGRAAMAGFATEALSRSLALLSLVAALFLLGRWVTFALLLRRLAFTLRHYRIAQGSIGFIVYLGVGLAIVGLLNLLFRSAPQTARAFGELLTLAFAAGIALWAISMAKRARDLVRQKLQ